MMMTRDPVDQLLREAAGNPTDPAFSRRAIRSALGLKLAQRERREARARVVRTVAIAASFVLVLCGQLGSDDFATKMTTELRNGREIEVYSQGLRGETVKSVPGLGPSAERSEKLLLERAAGEGIVVGLMGWQLGQEQRFEVLVEYDDGGEYVTSSRPVHGAGDRWPPHLRAFMRSSGGSTFATIVGVSESRAPDITMPMYFEGLKWDVAGWRIRLPGRDEIVYYRGLRADGVRSTDPKGF